MFKTDRNCKIAVVSDDSKVNKIKLEKKQIRKQHWWIKNAKSTFMEFPTTSLVRVLAARQRMHPKILRNATHIHTVLTKTAVYSKRDRAFTERCKYDRVIITNMQRKLFLCSSVTEITNMKTSKCGTWRKWDILCVLATRLSFTLEPKYIKTFHIKKIFLHSL